MKKTMKLGLAIIVLATLILQDSSRADPRKARLRVAVVIDASGSMKVQDRNLLSRVAAKLFVDLAGPHDEVGIVEFGTRARLIDRTFVKDDAARTRLFAAIDKIGRSQECTDYRVGLKAALSMFKGKPAPGERRLIIFLTDGSYDPDRTNPAYYAALNPEQKTSLYGPKVSAFFDTIKADPLFAQRPCRTKYALLEPGARAGFLRVFDRFLKKEVIPSKARVFVIGFGSDLGRTNTRGKQTQTLSESLALLKKLARVTKGRALIEHDVTKIPAFFAQIFAALVGAPVESLPSTDKQAAYLFEVVKGTRAVAAVVPVLADKKFDVAIERVGDKAAHSDAKTSTKPAGKNQKANAVTPTRTRHDDEMGQGKHKGQVLAGYRLLWLDHPKRGTYRLVARSGRKGRFQAQVVMDVGLKLAWQAPMPKPVYPERKQGSIEFRFALRTASGQKVAGLSKTFMQGMRFFWQLNRKGVVAPIATGQPQFDPSRPMETMVAQIPTAKLPEGSYTLDVWAAHDKGFFELQHLTFHFRVIEYIRMSMVWSTKDFHIKSKEGWTLGRWVEAAPGRDLKAVQWFVVDLSGIPNRNLLVIKLSNSTKECRVFGRKISANQVKVCFHKKTQGLRLDIALKSWTKARKKNASFAGTVTLTATTPAIFKGATSWQTKTKGTIVAWTWKDWLAFYRNWIIAALIALFILIWIIGRVLAGAFAPKATLYYRELEDNSDEASRFALGRRVKSHLPFRSAKHDIGGHSGRPRGGKTLATLIAARGGGFLIQPHGAVTAIEDNEEHRELFRGRYGNHYKAGDQHEFWVTRTPED